MIFASKTHNNKFFKYTNMKLVLLLLFLINLTASAKEPKMQYFVDAKGGLHLREEPSEKSKSILLIPDKSEIKILKEVGDTVKLNEKSGRWTEVNFGNKNGFVFGAYIRKYFLLDKKFSPNKKLFYEYYTVEDNKSYPCSVSDMLAGYEKDCLLNVYAVKNKEFIRAFSDNVGVIGNKRFEEWAWFCADGWFDEKSFLINCNGGDGGMTFHSIGRWNVFSGFYDDILDVGTQQCERIQPNTIERIKFNKINYYKIISENPKIQTGYFTMIKPKADDYDKLLETCKRDLKNSVLVKPTTVIRKNYTFKINSKKASLYFKGKDILKRDNID